MFKLLIVDDEEIARDGLMNLIDWGNIGITVVGCAENGEQALEIYKDHGADIVLTDIRMPYMDGLELMRNLKNLDSSVILIVLSAYDEFNYAKEALKLGAFDYILKPIDLENLINVVKKAVDVKSKEINRIQREKLVKNQLKESIPLLREKFISELLSGFVQKINEKIKYLDIDLVANGYCVIILKIDDYGNITENNSEEDIQLIDFMVSNIVNETIENLKHAMVTVNNGFYAIIIGLCNSDNKSEIISLCSDIRDNLNKFASLSVTQCVGRIVDDLNKVHISYGDAKSALEYRFYLGKNQVIFYDEVVPVTDKVVYYPVELGERLVLAIKRADKEEALKIFEKIWSGFKGKNLSFNIISRWCLEFVTLVTRSLLELGENPDVFFKSTDPWTIIRKLETMDDVHNWVKDIIETIIEYIALKRKSKNKKIVDKVIEIINNEYANKELTLNSIAERLFITPNYLSFLFKNETGENFTDYLIKVRMNKAKELLKDTELKIYEIADTVGYADPHHFSHVFKKHENMTPVEYRERILK